MSIAFPKTLKLSQVLSPKRQVLLHRRVHLAEDLGVSASLFFDFLEKIQVFKSVVQVQLVSVQQLEVPVSVVRSVDPLQPDPEQVEEAGESLGCQDEERAEVWEERVFGSQSVSEEQQHAPPLELEDPREDDLRSVCLEQVLVSAGVPRTVRRLGAGRC